MGDLSQRPSSQEQGLTVSEAERRVWKAVDELEEVINQVDNTPGKRDKTRRADLASTLMSFLAERYGIVPPAREVRIQRGKAASVIAADNLSK